MLFAEVVAFEAIILMAGYLTQPAAQVLFADIGPCAGTRFGAYGNRVCRLVVE